LSSWTDDVLHWLELTAPTRTQKTLWIATDNEENNVRIADAVFSILLVTETGFGPVQIDVAHQRTVLLPLIHGLARVPRYTTELVRIVRIHGFHHLGKWVGHLGQGPECV
jgi:hypothetical protein